MRIFSSALLVAFFLIALTLTARAAPVDSFIVGKPCPPIHLQHIENWSKDTASLGDFRGKWLVLDFWTKGCTVCFESFPITDSLKKRFADKVNFMLVAPQDRDGTTGALWQDYKSKKNLTLPCALDSLTFRQFNFSSVPQVIVLDANGIVRAWVNAISGRDLDSLLLGQKQYLSQPTTKSFNWRQPLLLEGNGGIDDDYSFRCIISRWNPSQTPFRPVGVGISEGSDLFQTSGATLADLYNLAYFGYNLLPGGRFHPMYAKICFHPILDLRDSANFRPYTKKAPNLWTISLHVPGSQFTKDKIQQILQTELALYFNYKATVEQRDCPYLALVATDSAKKAYRTKGGEPGLKGHAAGSFTMTNEPVPVFFNLVGFAFTKDPVLVDETGIEGNIDISMDEVITDKDSVLAELHRHGFDLIWKKRSMAVVVIKDHP